MRVVKIFRREFTELTGAIHNHSNCSYDCDVKLPDIIKAAVKQKLDYFTLNDHGIVSNCVGITKQVKIQAEENKLFVILGAEVNDNEEQYHLLTFNIKQKDLLHKYNDVCLAMKKMRTCENALLIAAHPFEERKSKRFPYYIWGKKDLIKESDGMEIWNFSSSWLSKLNPKVNGLLLLIFPNWFIRKPFKENLKIWDEAAIERGAFPAIGSTDAHGTPYKCLFVKFRILTHNYLFGTIRTNVLLAATEKYGTDEILEAIRKGNSYIINYRLGSPINFFAAISGKDTEPAIFGENIVLEPDLEYYFHLPQTAKVRLIRNGEVIAEKKVKYGSFAITEAGLYRLEITRFGMGWIYTNHIRVKQS